MSTITRPISQGSGAEPEEGGGLCSDRCWLAADKLGSTPAGQEAVEMCCSTAAQGSALPERAAPPARESGETCGEWREEREEGERERERGGRGVSG